VSRRVRYRGVSVDGLDKNETAWRRVIIETLVVLQLVRKSFEVCRNRMLLIIFTRSRHLILVPTKSTAFKPISLTHISILVLFMSMPFR